MDNKLLDLFSEEELESIKREAEQEAQQEQYFIIVIVLNYYIVYGYRNYAYILDK